MPPPQDDFVVLVVLAAILGVVVPILDVNRSNSAEQQLQLALVKDLDDVKGHNFIETFSKRSTKLSTKFKIENEALEEPSM